MTVVDTERQSFKTFAFLLSLFQIIHVPTRTLLLIAQDWDIEIHDLGYYHHKIFPKFAVRVATTLPDIKLSNLHIFLFFC